MKNFENIKPDLLELIKLKEFENLNAEEQEEILLYISKEEYYEIRKAILFAEDTISVLDIEPDSFLEQDIIQSLRNPVDAASSSIPGKISMVFGYKIPAYQAAAALALIIASFMFIFNDNYQSVKYIETTKTITDTVYKDKIIRIEIPVKETEHRKNNSSLETKSKSVRVTSNDNVKIPNNKYMAETYFHGDIVRKFDMISKRSPGKSATDDSLLTELLQTTY